MDHDQAWLIFLVWAKTWVSKRTQLKRYIQNLHAQQELARPLKRQMVRSVIVFFIWEHKTKIVMVIVWISSFPHFHFPLLSSQYSIPSKQDNKSDQSPWYSTRIKLVQTCLFRYQSKFEHNFKLENINNKLRSSYCSTLYIQEHII